MNGWDIDTPEGMALAKRWTAQHVARIKDGGIWAIPRSGAVYRLHHGTKTAESLAGQTRDSSVERVFVAMGWTVTVPQ